MLYALEYLGAAGLGVTSPQLFRADDGRVYVVKLQNNKLGPKVLANEFIGARLGEDLGLCFPPGGIIKLTEELLKKNRRLRAAGVTPGRHFASQFLNGTEYVCRHNIARAANLGEVAGVMFLDHLTHNLDRTVNRRNLLIRREGSVWRVYAIDNSHLFRRALWTEETLERLAARNRVNRHGVYGTLLKHYLKPDHFLPYLAKVKEWGDDYLGSVVAAIPGEWLPHATERQAMVKFLAARRGEAEAVATSLAALIPDKHRRADANKGE